MAAGTVLLYDFVAKYLMNGTIDLDAANVNMALVKSSYTPTQATDDVWADVSGEEIAAAFGYSAGGVALGTPVFTAITKGYKFSSANVTWTASGGSIAAWRYGVLYVNATVNSVVKPLIGYFLGDSTPADVPATTDTNVLTIACPAGGWFDMTRP
jgi:hypothetical protein